MIRQFPSLPTFALPTPPLHPWLSIDHLAIAARSALNLVAVVAGVSFGVSPIACAQFIRLIHVLIKYDVIAVTVNNVGVDSTRTHPSVVSRAGARLGGVCSQAQGGIAVLFCVC